MSRLAMIALGLMASALFSVTASAGEYYYGGYAPYPYPPYGGYPSPCCGGYPSPPVAVPYAPGPTVYSQPRLPPPPAISLSEGPRYYQYSGYGHSAAPCYDQYVRIPDQRGGWAWGVKSGCDQR
jgi:hypothetical protein